MIQESVRAGGFWGDLGALVLPILSILLTGVVAWFLRKLNTALPKATSAASDAAHAAGSAATSVDTMSAIVIADSKKVGDTLTDIQATGKETKTMVTSACSELERVNAHLERVNQLLREKLVAAGVPAPPDTGPTPPPGNGHDGVAPTRNGS